MRSSSDAIALSMQREAVKRVRNMENRSKNIIKAANVPPKSSEESAKSSDVKGLFESLMEKDGQKSFLSLSDGLQKAIGSAASPAKRLLDAFNIGGEELLILMIMYTVFKERGDASLLLALGYLLI